MIRKNWLVVPFIIIGFYYNFWRIQNSANEMMFQEFFYGCILLIFFIFLSFSFNKDFKKLKLQDLGKAIYLQ